MRHTLLLVSLLFGSALAQETQKPAQTAPAVTSVEVANIAGTSFSLTQFENEFSVVVGRMLNQQGMPYSEEGSYQFYPYRGDILKEYVDRQAVLVEAGRAGIKVADDEMAQELTRTKQPFPTPEAFADALKQAGFSSEAVLGDLIRESLMYGRYVDKLTLRYKFSDKAVESYYNGHKSEYTKAAQSCVKHILVPTAEDAAKVKTRLDAGEDFAKVAAEVSEDPGSKTRGGDLGCFDQGQMVPEFDKASFEGPIGQLQQVKTQFGEHLLVVSKRTDAGVTPLSEVSAAIQKTLAEQAATRYLQGAAKRLNAQIYADRVAKTAPAPVEPEKPMDAVPVVPQQEPPKQ